MVKTWQKPGTSNLPWHSFLKNEEGYLKGFHDINLNIAITFASLVKTWQKPGENDIPWHAFLNNEEGDPVSLYNQCLQAFSKVWLNPGKSLVRTWQNLGKNDIPWHAFLHDEEGNPVSL